MIFVYDILINFNDNYYNFYEWEENDYIEHIRKIPVIKVKNKFIKLLIEKNLIVNKTFLNSINNKCEIFNNGSFEKIGNTCVFCDENTGVVVIFDQNGFVKELSSLSLNEELEILDIMENQEIKNIKIKSLNNEYENSNLTRKEIKIVNNIIQTINKIKNDKEKIEYICYEWFENSNGSLDKMIIELKKDFSNKHERIVELLKLVS